MEAAPGDGGAFDHTSDGDVNVPSGIFFKGSTSEAIARAQQDDLVLIVFVAGDDEESVSMELTTFHDSAVLDEVKQHSLILRLQEGTIDAAYFQAIFPLSRVPTITFLGYKGSLLCQLEGYQGTEELLTALRQAVATAKTQLQQARAASAMVALLSSANMTASGTASSAPESQSAGNCTDEGTPVQSNSSTVANSVAPEREVMPTGQNEGSSMGVDVASRKEPTVVTSSPVNPVAHPIQEAGPSRVESRDERGSGGSTSTETNTLASKSSAAKNDSQVLKAAEARTVVKQGSGNGNGKNTSMRREQSVEKLVSVPRVRTGPFPLQVKLTNGETIQGTFESYQLLRDVKNFIDLQRTDGNMDYRLAVPFPRKIFTEEDMDKALSKLDIGPRSALLLVGNGTPSDNSYHSRTLQNNDSHSSAQSEANEGGGSYVGRFLSFLSPYVYGRSNSSQDHKSSSSAPPSESNPGTTRALRESSHPTIVNSSRPEPPVQENSAQAGRLSQRRGGSSNVHTLRGNDEDPSQGKNTYWNGNSTQFGGNDEAKED